MYTVYGDALVTPSGILDAGKDQGPHQASTTGMGLLLGDAWYQPAPRRYLFRCKVGVVGPAFGWVVSHVARTGVSEEAHYNTRPWMPSSVLGCRCL